MALESEGDRSGSGRLLHAVVGLLAAVVLAGAALLVYLGMTGEQAEALQGGLRDQRSLTAEVLRAMGDLAVADASVPPRLRAVADRVRAARGSLQAAASAAHLAEASAATVEGVEAAWTTVSARLDDLQRAASDLASQGGEGPARAKARADVSKAASAALAGLDEVRGGLDRLSAAAERPGAVRVGTLTLASAEITTALGFVAALLVVVAIAGLRLARARAQQLEHDAASTERAAARMAQEIAPLAEGDLRVRVSVGDPALGALGRSLNDTVAALRDIGLPLRGGAETVLSRARRLGEATAGLTGTAGETLAALHASDAAVAEATGILQDAMTRSRQLGDASQRVTQALDDLERTAERAAGGLPRVRLELEDATRRVERLLASVGQVDDAVELMEDIADQANVLALNADLHAASLGAGGQALGLLVERARQLDEVARDSARQMGACARTVLADAGTARDAIARALQEWQEAVRLADAIGQALGPARQAATQGIDANRSLGERVEQGAGRLGGLADGLAQLRVVLDGLAGSIRDAASSGAVLTDAAADLRRAVTALHLPD
jgi:methyl-accepting chemotaxis protein